MPSLQPRPPQLRGPPRGRPLALLALGMASCAGATSPCGPGRTCGDARWEGASPFAQHGSALVATAAMPEGEGPSLHRALTASRHRLVLRFDLGPVGLAGPQGVERVVLAIAPSPDAPVPDEAVRVSVRGHGRGGWDPAPVGSAIAPGGVRAGLRVDVTASVRAQLRDAAAELTLGVETDGPTLHFAGLGGPAEDLPRLEILSP